MLRSHDAGSLNAKAVGTNVTLAGWVARRRDHGGVAFIDLRDSTGAVQVVINNEKIDIFSMESKPIVIENFNQVRDRLKKKKKNSFSIYLIFSFKKLES